ncbi:MAG: hypothetical protein LJE95_10780, partial [Acidobacteria bacterium]|nr:hypothetical protein [Acidobacteriota bacterium]
LAQRYLEDDNWNILTPRAQSLVPVEGEVSAELPLVPYLAAVGARLVGKERLVELFRTLTVLLTALGPLALFWFVWSRTGSLVLALFPLIFLASCPVLFYYASGFVPDAPAFGFFCVGLVLVLRAASRSGSRGIVTGTVLITLAGVLKMTFAPYLAIPALVVLRRRIPLMKRGGHPSSQVRHATVPVIVLGAGGMAVITEFLYLKFRYWLYAPTYFNAAVVPFKSFTHLRRVAVAMAHNWLSYLLTPVQIAVVAAALVVVAVRVVRRAPTDELTDAMTAAVPIMLGLTFLFGGQLVWHDYYAIAIVYPLVTLLVLRLTSFLNELRMARWPQVSATFLMVGILAVAVAMAAQGSSLVRKRESPWWRSQVMWLKEAAGALDRCGAVCRGSVAVVGSEPPNLALTYLDRTGIVIGRDLQGGLHVPSVGRVRTLAAYMVQHDLRVLVVSRAVGSRLPQGALQSWFRPVAEGPEAMVLTVRRGFPSLRPLRPRGRLLSDSRSPNAGMPGSRQTEPGRDAGLSVGE